MAFKMIHAAMFRSSETEIEVIWSDNHIHRDNDVAKFRAAWAEAYPQHACPIMQFDSFVPFDADDQQQYEIVMAGVDVAVRKLRMMQSIAGVLAQLGFVPEAVAPAAVH